LAVNLAKVLACKALKRNAAAAAVGTAAVGGTAVVCTAVVGGTAAVGTAVVDEEEEEDVDSVHFCPPLPVPADALVDARDSSFLSKE